MLPTHSRRVGAALALVALAIMLWLLLRAPAASPAPALASLVVEAPQERSETTRIAPVERTIDAPLEETPAADPVTELVVPPTRAAVLRRAAEWLLEQQDADGGFGAALEGTSASFRREGWTGLALLALLGDGATTRDPARRADLERGLAFLLERMEREGAHAGLIGRADDGAALFNHGFAATALLEGAQLLGRADLLESARSASAYLVRTSTDPAARHVGRDPFTTVWSTLALVSGGAGEQGLDARTKERLLHALDERTDPETGAVGREIPGLETATPIGGLAHDPESGSQSATAAALFSRVLLGEVPEDGSLLARQAELLGAHAPLATPDGRTHDFLYWQLGTLATYQVGGPAWRDWSAALERALLSLYRSDDAPFAAEGPWARDAGSLGFVASAACSLQVLERFARLSHPSSR